MKSKNIVWLCESAVMIALSTVLSLIVIIELPYGGSVTAFSMLPIIMIAHRYGVKRGMFCGFVFGLLQLLLGIKALGGISVLQTVAAVLLDYILAFTLIGIGGAFNKERPFALTLGTLTACAVRYLCHVVSGCTVWAGVSIPSSDGLLYSVVYNAAYMIPETVITIAGAWYLSRILDFSKSRPQVRTKKSGGTLSLLFGGIGILLLLATAVTDALILFTSVLSDSGFDITLISAAPWLTLGIITVSGIVISGIFLALSNLKR